MGEGEVMIKIPRYRMTNNLGELDNDNGGWVRHEDHVAALEAATGQRCRKSLAHMITVIASATPPDIRVAFLALEKV